ncbi:hypothetical protein FA95DRAFT_1474026, partial [Auriscalpium vulgare]
VFTRVAGTEDAPDSILNASEDPQRLAAAIASRWRVIEKTTFGCRTSSTEGRECNSIVFSKGDFVDVAVTFDIAVHLGRSAAEAPVTTIHYDMKHLM